MSLPPLPPLQQPVAVFPDHIAQQPQILVVREKVLSLSGDSFDIKTIDGRALFKVQGHTVSLSGRKELLDMQGKHLLTIRKQHFSIPATYYAEDPSGNRFFELKGKFSLGTSKTLGKFHNTITNRPEVLFMKGNFFDTNAQITNEQTGAIVAQIDRKFLNARELIGGQQTYAVNVAPGMDMALIVAMVICLDEKRNEK